MVEKKNKWFSFRAFLSILTLGLVFWVVYENREGFVETFRNLNQANIFVILLLVPEQLFMYYACGQIFFSYLEGKYRMKFSRADKLKISTELNFVNRAVPAGAVGGLAYLTFRLKPYGVAAGQASFLYIFRFAITTVVNYVQALVAILILYALGAVPDEATWIIWVSLLMNMGVFLVLGLVIYVASSKKRIEWFASIVERLIRFVVRVLTFNKKKSLFKKEKVQEYFLSIHDCVMIVKKDKKSLIKPTIWGFIYSLCEIGVYWIVATSLGRPEILPVIMVGEAIGSVFDGIVPYGLYELGMAGVMIALGVDFSTATIVTVMTRVITLLFTIASGSYPYYEAIRGKDAG
jgi:hypothetical protein